MSHRSRPYHHRGGGGGSWRQHHRPPGGLEPGLRGFLCTCNNRERECVREAQNLLGEYADLLFGRESWRTEPTKVEEDEEDIADSVQREVQQLQAATKTNQPRFRVLNSGAKNCVFISSTVPDPGLLVHRLLSDLKASQRQRARFMNRLLPVEVTCRASLDDITQAASKLFDKYFAEGNKSFAIIYKCRNNSSLQRDALIEALADLVKLKNASNCANLTSPDLAVLVEVLRTTCCLAVVTDYFTLAKYNVIEVAGKPVAAAAGDAEEDGAASSLPDVETAEPSDEDQKACNTETDPNPTTVDSLPPTEPVNLTTVDSLPPTEPVTPIMVDSLPPTEPVTSPETAAVAPTIEPTVSPEA